MGKLQKKLKSQKGESLTETLAAVLVISLASAAMLSMISAASNITQRVKDYDRDTYGGITAAEVQSGTGEAGTVTVREDGASRSVAVTYYQDAASGLCSYKVKP